MNIDDLTVKELRDIARLTRTMSEPKKKPAVENKRAVVIVDRGWIFAGDMSETSDGYILLKRAIHVFSWSSIGFAKMIEDWRSDKVDLRPVTDVEIPKDSVIFRVPVSSDWGLKTEK